MHKPQSQVQEFHRECAVHTPNEPTIFGYPFNLRVDLIMEEADEFAEACAERDMPGMIDAIVDLLYVTYGAAEAMGIDVEPFFDLVHEANLKKASGPVREDGKRLKPPGWKAPDIEGLLKQLHGDVE